MIDSETLNNLLELDNFDLEPTSSFNIAFSMQDNELQKLANFLLESVEKDEESRNEWLEPIKKVQSYLGIEFIEDNTITLEGLTKTTDPTFVTTLIRAFSLIRGEFFGDIIIDTKIQKNFNDEMLQNIAEKIKEIINNYFNIIDELYIPDCEKLILHYVFYGTAFKKVYFDNFKKAVVVRFVNPLDLIVNINCTNILESNRITHIYSLSKTEILFNIEQGIYKDNANLLKTSDEDIENSDKISAISNNNEDGANRKIYEIHTYLNLDNFTKNLDQEILSRTIPLPYIVTIDKNSETILSIIPNPSINNALKGKSYFAPYLYLPGFGPYGLGLAHLIGPTAISLTKMLRISIDAAYYASLPCGFISSGFLKNQDNTIRLAAGELMVMDTGGLPINQLYAPIPFSGPSPVLNELRLTLENQIQNLAAVAELGVGDANSNLPVGTTLALLEEQTRIRSAVMRSFYHSFQYELSLFFDLFKETTNPAEIIGIDFYPEEISIIPNADPSFHSGTQKIIRAEALLKTASMDPTLHNMPEVFKIFYEAIGIAPSDIQKILKSPEELANMQQQNSGMTTADSLLMAQIEADKAETEAKERIANEKAESEIFKSQLNFEATKAKIESNEAIAELKAETELEKANIKNNQY